MSLTTVLASVSSNPPNRWAVVGSVLALAATCSVSFWTGLGTLACSVVLLLLNGYKDERQLAMKLASDEKQLAMKHEHEASQRENDRQHEGKKWKHEKALALINAPARTTTGSSVMAVA